MLALQLPMSISLSAVVHIMAGLHRLDGFAVSCLILFVHSSQMYSCFLVNCEGKSLGPKGRTSSLLGKSEMTENVVIMKYDRA